MALIRPTPLTEVSMDIALLVLFLVFFFWQTVTD